MCSDPECQSKDTCVGEFALPAPIRVCDNKKEESGKSEHSDNIEEEYAIIDKNQEYKLSFMR